MNKFFTYFFIVLGVLFLIQLIVLACFFIIDPYNLKPLLFKQTAPAAQNTSTNTNASGEVTASEGSAPALSPAQAAALEAAGLSAEAGSFNFTEAQQACFEAKLGAARVAEIKGGAVPTFSEFGAAKECM
jgi:hypothetical protein